MHVQTKLLSSTLPPRLFLQKRSTIELVLPYSTYRDAGCLSHSIHGSQFAKMSERTGVL